MSIRATGGAVRSAPRPANRTPEVDSDKHPPEERRYDPTAVGGLSVHTFPTTSRAHLSLKGKVERWVHRLAETETLDEGGVMVLFLDVADTRLGSGVLTVTRQTIEEVLDDYPWSVSRQIGHRIALARWVDFFPSGPGLVDRSAFPVYRR